MSNYYDDNFGHYDDFETEEDEDFYHMVQKRSVVKKCAGCGEMVRIMPQYAYCNACAEKRERGWDF